MSAVAGVLTTRVADLPEPWVPGSTQSPCGTCGEPCWLSPSSASSVAAGVPPICRQCMTSLVEREGTQVFTALPGAIAEYEMFSPDVRRARA